MLNPQSHHGTISKLSAWVYPGVNLKHETGYSPTTSASPLKIGQLKTCCCSAGNERMNSGVPQLGAGSVNSKLSEADPDAQRKKLVKAFLDSNGDSCRNGSLFFCGTGFRLVEGTSKGHCQFLGIHRFRDTHNLHQTPRPPPTPTTTRIQNPATQPPKIRNRI